MFLNDTLAARFHSRSPHTNRVYGKHRYKTNHFSPTVCGPIHFLPLRKRNAFDWADQDFTKTAKNPPVRPPPPHSSAGTGYFVYHPYLLWGRSAVDKIFIFTHIRNGFAERFADSLNRKNDSVTSTKTERSPVRFRGVIENEKYHGTRWR